MEFVVWGWVFHHYTQGSWERACHFWNGDGYSTIFNKNRWSWNAISGAGMGNSPFEERILEAGMEFQPFQARIT